MSRFSRGAPTPWVLLMVFLILGSTTAPLMAAEPGGGAGGKKGASTPPVRSTQPSATAASIPEIDLLRAEISRLSAELAKLKEAYNRHVHGLTNIGIAHAPNVPGLAVTGPGVYLVTGQPPFDSMGTTAPRPPAP